jgi:hypothetical protein
MSTFLTTTPLSIINLHLLRRDFFDGISLLLQDEDGTPVNLNDVVVCSSVWKKTSDTSYTKIVDINVEEQEPLSAGRIRLWLTSSQTGTIWDNYDQTFSTGGTFFPNTYVQEQGSLPLSMFWDVRIEREQELSDLISVASGVFISQINHGLASTERVVFSDTTESSINYDGTSSTIYSGLTDISYQAPYTFTIPSLSGVTDAAIGGSVYRLKQDTVVAGGVIVGNTLSNCFP